jgi:hypothetical protein
MVVEAVSFDMGEGRRMHGREFFKKNLSSGTMLK